ncbi:hypothetical protein PPACK8108_LOCUS21928, partial [Phakopsora pachyrhizi]
IEWPRLRRQRHLPHHSICSFQTELAETLHQRSALLTLAVTETMPTVVGWKALESSLMWIQSRNPISQAFNKELNFLKLPSLNVAFRLPSTSMLSTFLKSVLEPHPIVQGHSGYKCKWCSRIITEELICCQTANTKSIKEPVLAFAFGKFDGITNRYLPFTLGTTSSTSADTEAGEAVFGGLDKAHYEGKIYYAPVRRCGYWEVELKSVKFGDKEIKLHNVGAAINTGQ